MDWVLNMSIFDTFLGVAMTSIAGFTLAFLVRSGKGAAAIGGGTRALIRKELIDAWTYYFVKGHEMDTQTYFALRDLYRYYKALGGNDGVDELWADLRTVRPASID